MDQIEELKSIVEGAWDDRSRLSDDDVRTAIRRTVALLDSGRIRVAEPAQEPDGQWTVSEWIKTALLPHTADAYHPRRRTGVLRQN